MVRTTWLENFHLKSLDYAHLDTLSENLFLDELTHFSGSTFKIVKNVNGISSWFIMLIKNHKKIGWFPSNSQKRGLLKINFPILDFIEKNPPCLTRFSVKFLGFPQKPCYLGNPCTTVWWDQPLRYKNNFSWMVDIR